MHNTFYNITEKHTQIDESNSSLSGLISKKPKENGKLKAPRRWEVKGVCVSASNRKKRQEKERKIECGHKSYIKWDSHLKKTR